MRAFTTTLLSVFFAISAYAQSPAVTNFMDNYAGDENFTEVNISPKMFEMFAQMDTENNIDSETLEMIKSLKGLRILTTEVNPRQHYKDFMSSVNVEAYEELMTVKSDGSDVKFLVKDTNGNIVNELLLVVGGDDDFVLMSFAGKIELDKLGKLASNLNFSGSEHLKNLKKED